MEVTQAPRQFTDSDVSNASGYDHVYADRTDLVYDPPAWMKAGRMETASGYGKRLNSGLKIHFNGKLYRIYITIFSNNGTAWFVSRGRKIVVS